jgi:ABC-type tungstate transport system permease subunit
MRTRSLFLVLAVLICSCRRDQPPRAAVLLVTPEVAATGMPEQLVAAFMRQTSRPVAIRIVTDEQIVRETAATTGSAVIYTDPALIAQTRLRAAFATHDYYILGPKDDPARVSSAETAADAFSRIASRNRPFCSAVDVERLRSAEREIWSAARVSPTFRRYRRCRGSAGEALTATARMSAYTLSDRATVERVASKRLHVLLREKPLLHETYVVALLQSDRRTFSRDAEWFVQWLMSYRGRETLLQIKEASLPSLTVPGQH